MKYESRKQKAENFFTIINTLSMKKLELYAAPLLAASMLGVSASFLTSCGSKPEQATAAEKGKETIVSAASVKSNVTKVVALGRVEPEEKISSLSMDVAGVVQKIFVSEGQRVTAGTPILELAHDVESSKMALSQAKSATQTNEVAVIKASLQSAQLKMQNLKDRLQRSQNLVQSGAETQQNLDNAKTDYETAVREVERLQASLQSAQSKLAECNADARVSAAEVARRVLRAPSDGMILDIDPTVGASVSSGKALAEFAPNGAVTVLCEVDELFVEKLQLGQKATIRPQGSNETLAEGEVMWIGAYLKKKSIFSDEAGALEDRRVREVRVKLAGGSNLLFNSRVECVIAVK
jgi:multidrug efflux pump subunit AcrA (membrane-fusion protein)